MSLTSSWVEVSPERLRSNVLAFRGILNSSTKLMVVVKSNAYGHGLELTSNAIAADVDWFGVDSVPEAVAIDDGVGGKPILLLGYGEPGQARVIVERGFRQVVYRMDLARILSGEARRQSRTVRVHLKIETGTNRQGVPLHELRDFAGELKALENVEIEGVYTHFANIEDTLDPSYAKTQIERFKEAVVTLGKLGIEPPEIHAAATAGILLYPETHFSMVRLGIGAYGLWPSRETRLAVRERGLKLTLESALTWKSRIAQLRRIEAGEYVGYGLTFRASHSTTLAIVPTGYYEGYPRHLSGSGRAVVGGQSVPVIGRVAMNMIVLDVSDVKDPKPDDEVVLIGRAGGAEVTADELAAAAGTISYEIIARINPLLARKSV